MSPRPREPAGAGAQSTIRRSSGAGTTDSVAAQVQGTARHFRCLVGFVRTQGGVLFQEGFEAVDVRFPGARAAACTGSVADLMVPSEETRMVELVTSHCLAECCCRVRPHSSGR